MSPKDQICQPMSIGKLTMPLESLSNSILNLTNHEVLDIKLPLRNQVSYQPLLNTSEPLMKARSRQQGVPHHNIQNVSMASK